jgi:hypothetical protein
MQAYANPTRFLAIQATLQPWLWGATALLFAVGLYLALVQAPADYQQGETVRIMYVHVPAAWMALFVYTLMAIASIVAIVFRHPLADVAAKSAAPIGAAFTFLALATGALWGKPMWGAWWVWDARITSMFVLLLLYLGYMAVWQAIEERGTGGAHRGHRRHRRVHQRADHQVLGGLVEHAAPAGERAAAGWARHPCLDAGAADRHGAGLCGALHGAAYAGDPHRGDGAPGPADRACRGRRGVIDGFRRQSRRFRPRGLWIVGTRARRRGGDRGAAAPPGGAAPRRAAGQRRAAPAPGNGASA